MTDITVLNSSYDKKGSLKVDVDLSTAAINLSVVHQVVKATLAGRRQGTAMTKTKGFVSGGGKKPFKQKGTGNARQGSNRSPIMVGGGTTFGPVPRDYTQKINKATKAVAIQSILADKFNSGKLHVVEKIESTGKTKDLFNTLSKKNILPALIVTASDDSKALLAGRNLKNAKALPVKGFSVYEAVKFENLIIEKAALENLIGRLV